MLWCQVERSWCLVYLYSACQVIRFGLVWGCFEVMRWCQVPSTLLSPLSTLYVGRVIVIMVGIAARLQACFGRIDRKGASLSNNCIFCNAPLP